MGLTAFFPIKLYTSLYSVWHDEPYRPITLLCCCGKYLTEITWFLSSRLGDPFVDEGLIGLDLETYFCPSCTACFYYPIYKLHVVS